MSNKAWRIVALLHCYIVIHCCTDYHLYHNKLYNYIFSDI